MKIAIVTGASKGIGQHICKTLLKNNYYTYGIARDFSSCDISDDSFKQIQCDITQSTQFVNVLKHIIDNHKQLDVLVNNAGIGFFGPHETLSVTQIEQMVQTNLTAPLIATKQCLFWLRKSQGTVINIASIAAIHAKGHGAAYSASKAGMLHFGNCLFEETRKQGIKVTTICPDLTFDTNFFKNTSFTPANHPEAHLLPTCISDAVDYVLNARPGTVIQQMTIQPQKFQITKH